MAFKVEDGSGIIDANSYATVDGYKAYLKDRGITVTTGSTVIQSGLIQATDYIDTRNGQLFRGQKANQSLDSRSILTLASQPIEDETVTVGTVVYTFKDMLTVPAVENEVEIGENLLITLNNLGSVMINSDNEDLLNVTSDQVDTLQVFTVRDGIATTTTMTNGSFDVPESVGFSAFEQPLQFPRADLFDQRTGLTILGVPVDLMKATYEYAKRAIDAPLLPDPVTDPTGLKPTGTKSVVGPIEIENRYSDKTVASITKPYPAADLLLTKYLQSTGRAVRN